MGETETERRGKVERHRKTQTEEVGRQKQTEKEKRHTQAVASIFGRVMSFYNDPHVLLLACPPLGFDTFTFSREKIYNLVRIVLRKTQLLKPPILREKLP